jgi:hypothetical protein
METSRHFLFANSFRRGQRRLWDRELILLRGASTLLFVADPPVCLTPFQVVGRRRPDLPSNRMLMWSGVAAFACGLTSAASKRNRLIETERNQ